MLLGYLLPYAAKPFAVLPPQPLGAIVTLIGIVTGRLIWLRRQYLQVEHERAVRRLQRESIISAMAAIRKEITSLKDPDEKASKELWACYTKLAQEVKAAPLDE